MYSLLEIGIFPRIFFRTPPPPIYNPGTENSEELCYIEKNFCISTQEIINLWLS